MQHYRRSKDRPTAQSLPCIDCGQLVNDPGDIIEETAAGAFRMLAGGFPHVLEKPVDLVFTRDPRCLTRNALAAAIVDLHPRVLARLGDRQHVVRLVESALIAFDILGVAREFQAKLTAKDRGLLAVIDTMSVVGAASRWAARYLPVTRLGYEAGQHAPSRWGFLTEVELQRVRDAYALLLHATVGKGAMTWVTAPDGRGCLICGVGAVEGSASESRAIWGEPWQARPETLGGKGGPEPISGYLCPADRKIAERIGALGQSVMQASIIEFLGVQPVYDVEIDGLRAWCALPERVPPNQFRWQHEPDHLGLAKSIAVPAEWSPKI